MQGRGHRILRTAGWPLRMVLIGLIRLYRLTLGPAFGGACRFYPSCSAYAEEAIRSTGAVRGVVLAAWRVLRCSPLTGGGVDRPPARLDRSFVVELVERRRDRESSRYDAVIREGSPGSAASGGA